MFSSVKSLQGFACAQVFVNDVNFTRIYTMKRKGEAGNALLEFIRDVSIPSTLHTDNAKELTGGEWKKVASDHQIMQTLAEPYSPW
jgi:ABC-type iron transport system FetAB ATPase subunit